MNENPSNENQKKPIKKTIQNTKVKRSTAKNYNTNSAVNLPLNSKFESVSEKVKHLMLGIQRVINHQIILKMPRI